MGILAKLGGLAMVMLPEGVVKKIYSSRQTYRGQTIDAKALAVGKFAMQLREDEGEPNVAESRAQTDQITRIFDSKGPKLARIENFELEGAQGKIKARLYADTSDKSQLQPCLVFFHGGGFIQGNLESHNQLCAKIAGWGGGIVIAVDYRLAPEHPYPAGVDDALGAYLWIIDHARELGIDYQRIGVGGDSAGGCFATVVAQQAIEMNKPVPAFQVLVYPVTDGHLDTPSINELQDAAILPKQRMVWYRDVYRADFDDFDDPKFSPIFYDKLDQMPPTYLITAGFDPLFDDGANYANKLKAAGVKVTHRHFPGQLHAFLSLTKVIPQGNIAIKEIAAWLKQNWSLKP